MKGKLFNIVLLAYALVVPLSVAAVGICFLNWPETTALLGGAVALFAPIVLFLLIGLVVVLVKSLSRNPDERSDNTPKAFDLTTAREWQIEVAAQTGNVTPEVERAVDELLELQRKSPLVKAYGFEAKGYCSCGGDEGSVRIRDGVFQCQRCGRSGNLNDYDNSYDGRHKVAVRIGERLNESGGFKLMQLVAYRFVARMKGQFTDATHMRRELQEAWKGIGFWKGP